MILPQHKNHTQSIVGYGLEGKEHTFQLVCSCGEVLLSEENVVGEKRATMENVLIGYIIHGRQTGTTNYVVSGLIPIGELEETLKGWKDTMSDVSSTGIYQEREREAL